MCKLNNGFFISGGCDTKTKIDHNMYLWAPGANKYDLIQTIFNAHGADINSIILLRDGKIASSSRDRTVKIWEVSKSIDDNKIQIVISQELNHYGHGLYRLVQLKDDRLVVSSTDNNLVFWRNGDSVF
jgi:WD40 repeat protein